MFRKTSSPSPALTSEPATPLKPAQRGLFCGREKNVYFWYLTTVNHWYIFTPIEALHSPSGGPQASPLFNNQRNNQQTALPLPATGDQTAPKGCLRQGQPCTADEGETPKPRERPGHAMRPATPAVMGQSDSLKHLGDRVLWKSTGGTQHEH